MIHNFPCVLSCAEVSSETPLKLPVEIIIVFSEPGPVIQEEMLTCWCFRAVSDEPQK